MEPLDPNNSIWVIESFLTMIAIITVLVYAVINF